MKGLPALNTIQEYHKDCEPAAVIALPLDVYNEWENVIELLQEAKSNHEIQESLEACLEFHLDWKPTTSFEINDWRLFLKEVQESIDEVTELSRKGLFFTRDIV